mmetsp:Transcript_21527/g.32036  ORF Transcript_21527/g.32036 Transcript_21527/m.32036 type:complete len:382 (-) Transcript_21527:168-1313(-)
MKGSMKFSISCAIFAFACVSIYVSTHKESALTGYVRARSSVGKIAGNVRQRIQCARASSVENVEVENVGVEKMLPRTKDQMISQATKAIEKGMDEGKKRYRVDFLLPINEKKYNFLAIESMDYPCSIKEEFLSAVELGEALIKDAFGASEISTLRLDDGGIEGDPCMLLRSKDANVIVFPFADNLNQIEELAEQDKPVILINPQWKNSGQIVSDFGFGPWKKKADNFLETFLDVYSLVEQRVGAPSSLSLTDGKRYSDGGVVRTLRSFPDEYTTFVMAVDGASQEILRQNSMPDYGQISDAIAEGRKQNLEIFDYAKDAIMPNPFTTSSTSSAIPSNEVNVDSLDKTSIRQALEERGLPTSGTLVKIRERLRAALAAETEE